MTITELRDRAFENAKNHGFHQDNQNVGEMLMLVVSELSEALEADRKRNYSCDTHTSWLKMYANRPTEDDGDTFDMIFAEEVKDTFEDEIADALIRILDLAGYLNIDLEAHVLAKMRYNEGRPYKHGKKY